MFMYKKKMPNQNLERTSVKHSLTVPTPLFYSYQTSMSSVIYY